MSDGSKIEWTDATWNPVTGCTKVSPGCDHCYAETFAERFRGVPGHHFEQGFDVTLRPERLIQPARWTKPRRIFVNSMSDLFHDSVPDYFIAQVFGIMAAAPQHTFQLLTKRHGRMRSLLNGDLYDLVVNELADENGTLPSVPSKIQWPLPNVWVGVSVETQQWANIRIPALLDTLAAVRWISAEPLLGHVDLRDCGGVDALERDWIGGPGGGSGAPHPLLDWVVAGGESGAGARPMHPAWARTLRDQCTAAGVPFLFKQFGEWGPTDETIVAKDPRTMAMHPAGMVALTRDNPFDPFARGHPHWETLRRYGKAAAGRELEGRTWDEYPATSPNPSDGD